VPSDDGALQFDPTPSPEVATRVTASDKALREYLSGVIREPRAAPREDLISALVAVQDTDGSQLSDAEAVSCLALLLFAGNVTTTDLIGNGLLISGTLAMSGLHALMTGAYRHVAAGPDTSLVKFEVRPRFQPPASASERCKTPDPGGSLGGCISFWRDSSCRIASFLAGRSPSCYPPQHSG